MSSTTRIRSGRGPGRPPKAEAGDTKRTLVEAALSLFARNGYAGTSIRAIAREVGLSESVLYAHFESKRAVYQAVMELSGPRIPLTALDDGSDADPAAFIRDFASQVFTAWDRPQARKLISVVSREGIGSDDDLVTGIEQALDKLSELFARWIQRGGVRDDLGTPEELAYALLSPIGHARLLWLHSDATSQQRSAARRRILGHADLIAKAVAPGHQGNHNPADQPGH